MNKEEKEHIERMNNAFLYEVGYQHMNNICKEMDCLEEEYKDVEIPDTLHTWFRDFDKKIMDDKRIKKRRKVSWKILRQIAVASLILLIAISGVTLSVEAFRVRLFNMFIETKETYSDITFEIKDDYTEGIPEDWKSYYAMTNIPDQFILTEAFKTEQSGYLTYEFSEYYIMFIQGSLDLEVQIDTENREILEVNVSEYNGMLVKNNEEIMLIWNNEEACFRIISNLDEDTIIKIAENLKKIKK